MKRKRNVFLAAIAVLALSLGGTIPTVMAQGIAAPVEGSWIFFLTPPPEGGPAGNNSFTALVSFAAGGVWLGTGTNDRIAPVSELHGVWERARFQKQVVATATASRRTSWRSIPPVTLLE